MCDWEKKQSNGIDEKCRVRNRICGATAATLHSLFVIMSSVLIIKRPTTLLFAFPRVRVSGGGRGRGGVSDITR